MKNSFGESIFEPQRFKPPLDLRVQKNGINSRYPRFPTEKKAPLAHIPFVPKFELEFLYRLIPYSIFCVPNSIFCFPFSGRLELA